MKIDPEPNNVPDRPGKHSGDKPYLGYLELGYGLSRLADHREVLFNRKYKSMWVRNPGSPATRTKLVHVGNFFPDVPFVSSPFWTDDVSPQLNAMNWKRAEQILLKFITGRPVAHLLLDITCEVHNPDLA